MNPYRTAVATIAATAVLAVTYVSLPTFLLLVIVSVGASYVCHRHSHPENY